MCDSLFTAPSKPGKQKALIFQNPNIMPLLNFIFTENNPPQFKALCNTVKNRNGPTAFIYLILGSVGRYTLSVKLSDFTV